MQAKWKEPLIYKYFPPRPYAREALASYTLLCRHYSDFNDPFEFWTKIEGRIPDKLKQPDRFAAAALAWGFPDTSQEAVIENHESYFELPADCGLPFSAMLDRARITCFSSDSANLLMWSHYADGLRGFCLGFDKELLIKSLEGVYVTDVPYLEQPPLVDSFVYAVAQDQYDFHLQAIDEVETEVKYGEQEGFPGELKAYADCAQEAFEHMTRMWALVFAAKPIEWKYEREVRLMLNSDKGDQAPLVLEYPKGAVTELILGERMPQDYEAALRKMASDAFPGIPIRNAKRANDAYRMEITN